MKRVHELGIDDGFLEGYRPLPLLTPEPAPELEDAVQVYGFAFYTEENHKSKGVIFLDLNPRILDREEKQKYRKEVADELIHTIDTLSPKIVWACNYFSENGPKYYDNSKKKHLFEDLEKREDIIVKYGEGGLVEKAHYSVTRLLDEFGQYFDFKLDKLCGWAKGESKIEDSAEEFLSWHNTEFRNGINSKVLVTRQLQDYINGKYSSPLHPHTHSRKIGL